MKTEHASPRSLRLDGLTWPEISSALESGYKTIIVPCGATEQHGPHLPLSVDSIHAEKLAHEVAARLGNTLICPVFPFGLSRHHMSFPGTISLTQTAFREVMLDTFRSLEHHGFTRILCFSGHIGNFAELASLERHIDESQAFTASIDIFHDRENFTGVWRSIVGRMTGFEDRVGCHADIAETSIMLATLPETVRHEQIAWGSTAPLSPSEYQTLFGHGVDKLSNNGILGDANGATPELGHRLVSEMADLIADRFDAPKEPL